MLGLGLVKGTVLGLVGRNGAIAPGLVLGPGLGTGLGTVPFLRSIVGINSKGFGINTKVFAINTQLFGTNLLPNFCQVVPKFVAFCSDYFIDIFDADLFFVTKLINATSIEVICKGEKCSII